MTYKKNSPDHSTVSEKSGKGFAQNEKKHDMKEKTKAGKGFAQSERGTDVEADTDAGKGFAQNEGKYEKKDEDFPSD